MVQVNAYDLAGRPTRDVLESSVYTGPYLSLLQANSHQANN